MVLKMKRILAAHIAAVLCLAITICAAAEVTSRSKESNGRVVETVWTDENGQSAAGPEGYASVRYSYNRADTFEQYYDADGKPAQANGGYYGRRVERDGKKRITAIEYLDQNGQRMDNLDGYAQVTIAYTSWGAVRQVSYTNKSKKLVIVPSLGYASRCGQTSYHCCSEGRLLRLPH